MKILSHKESCVGAQNSFGPGAKASAANLYAERAFFAASSAVAPPSRASFLARCQALEVTSLYADDVFGVVGSLGGLGGTARFFGFAVAAIELLFFPLGRSRDTPPPLIAGGSSSMSSASSSASAGGMGPAGFGQADPVYSSSSASCCLIIREAISFVTAGSVESPVTVSYTHLTLPTILLV